MKKILLILLLGILVLAGCSGGNKTVSTENKSVTVTDITNRINDALKQMGNKTKLKIVSSEVNKDGKTVITLSDNIMIFLETDNNKHVKKATLGMVSDAYFIEKNDFNFAFLLLVGVVDNTLSYGDRQKVINQLGLSDEKTFIKDKIKVVNVNNVQYTYKGSIKDNFLLQAEYQ